MLEIKNKRDEFREGSRSDILGSFWVQGIEQHSGFINEEQDLLKVKTPVLL